MTIKLSEDMLIWSRGWDDAQAKRTRVPPADIGKNLHPFWFEGYDEATEDMKTEGEGNKYADANDDAYTITDANGNIVKP